MKLNKVRIVNFLEQVISDYIWNIKFDKGKECGEGVPAAVDEHNNIWINRNVFYTQSLLYQKAILLHEAGHIVIGTLSSKTNTEYYAHLWALKVAKDNGWKNIYQELETMIISWFLCYKWNEDKGIQRPYIQASKKYLRKKKYEKKNIKKTTKV